MTSEPEWVLFEPDDGRSPVTREIRKAQLTKHEVAELDRLKERIRTGEVLPNDCEYLQQYSFWEAKLSGDRRIFRLLYAERADGLILLALLFTPKKSGRLSPAIFRTAAKRLRQWDTTR